MRIRTVKPEFFLHDGLYELERESKLPVRISYAGLWCAADREGRFKWEPRRLGAQILPYDGIDFSRVLHALATRGFICRYASLGVEYGCIPSFSRHQVINNRERPSEIPPPPNPLNDNNIDACPTRDPRVVDFVNLDQEEGNKEQGREQGMEQGTGNGKEGGCKGGTLLLQIQEPKEPKRKSQLCDAEFIATLKADPTYDGINVDVELGKCSTWCRVRGKQQPSRRRFVNWLNKSERPMSVNSQAQPGNVQPGNAVSDRIERSAELRIVNERLAELDRHLSRDPHDCILWKPGQREEYQKLRARKKELEGMICKV